MNVAFVLSIFIHFSFFWCIGRALRRDFDSSWLDSLIFTELKRGYFGCAQSDILKCRNSITLCSG